MENKDTLDPYAEEKQLQSVTNRSSIPLIVGIILIIAGFLSIINWVSYFSLDVTTITKMVNVEQLKQISPDMTPEKLLGFFRTCAIIGCVIAVFPILGGILALKRKMWGVSLACSIIGLFSIGMLFSSSLLSFVAMIILIFWKKEFQ